MQTRIASRYQNLEGVERAEEILRKCVHCGFCLATCPTYSLLGNELDSPRGRIYQIKSVLEGGTPTARIQQHLDRCLTCRSCETTCPSGVEYGELADIGRHLLENAVKRPIGQRLTRAALNQVLPHANLLRPMVGLGRMVKPVLPAALAEKIPARQAVGSKPAGQSHARVMLALGGCAQPVLTPATDAALARILDKLGISLVTPGASGCCGALSWHLSKPQQGKQFMQRNIDAWWSALRDGAEAIVVTASGCATMVQDYQRIFADDPQYAEKARLISEKLLDPAEVLAAEDLKPHLRKPAPSTPIAFHEPCTLQHGRRLPGRVAKVLLDCGFKLVDVQEPHLCCGSAGSYALLQPEISSTLKARKLGHLQRHKPAEILTANIGCQLHLQSGTTTPVRHWLEAVDELMQ